MAGGLQRGSRGTAFSIYLRTGQRIGIEPIEVKFNPYHDLRNGRFTFAPGGVRSGPVGSRPRRSQPSASSSTTKPRTLDPRDPANYTIHVVKRGDTLERIASLRSGVTVEDLAWLNDIPPKSTLRIGQPIKLPTQQSRDAARDAKNRVLALDYYMQTHGGRLPANVAHPPSLQQQMFRQLGWREINANGYTFAADKGERTRYVDGDLQLAAEKKRSRTEQARAGGSDRRATDEGGHYIAVRFNGPSESFNHFAQNTNFNRSAYLALENKWAKALRGGHRVHVNIIPHYNGASRRPDSLDVTWYVDGRKQQKTFPNRSQGK